VILICEHGQDGSLGFVLNQISELRLEDLGEDFENIDMPLYIGGPVDHNTLHFIHTLGDKIENSIKLNDRYYWSGNMQFVLDSLRLGIYNESQIRFFLGYSGWSRGQLERELKAKTWVNVTSYDDDLFDLDIKNMWRTILNNQGGKLKEISNYPIDPRLN
jgi:putative transcriptional regulator